MRTLRALKFLFVSSPVLAMLAIALVCCHDATPRPGVPPEVLDEVCRLVAENHYDPTLHDLDWSGICAESRVLVRESASRAESVRTIDAMLQLLGDSHCGFGEVASMPRKNSPYLFGAGSPGWLALARRVSFFGARDSSSVTICSWRSRPRGSSTPMATRSRAGASSQI